MNIDEEEKDFVNILNRDCLYSRLQDFSLSASVIPRALRR